MPNDENNPIAAQEAKHLFADWKTAPAIVLAVSGGPDSVALMWLVARWRRRMARAPGRGLRQKVTSRAAGWPPGGGGSR